MPSSLFWHREDAGNKEENTPLLGESGTQEDLSFSRPHLPHIDVIQFALPISVAHVADGKIELRILRIESGAGTGQTVSFSYRTEEASAKGGVDFEHVSGVIEMRPGEEEKSIFVPIRRPRLWKAILEFHVILSDPIRCELDASLYLSRVKITQGKAFPDDTFQDEVSQGVEAMKSIHETKIYFNFIRYLMAIDGIKWRTAVMIFVGVLKNAYHYLMMVTSVYMVDNIFNADKPASGLAIPGSRLHTAYLVSFLTLAPMLVFFILDHIVVRLDVRGLLRVSVSRNLFRKFMNFSHEAAQQTPVVDMVDGCSAAVSEVTFSYMKLIEMVRLGCEIGLSIFFTLQNNPTVWWSAILIPSVMVLWGGCRFRAFLQASENVSAKEEACSDFANEILTKLPLVASYARRPQMNILFAKRAEALQQAKVGDRAVELTNMFVPHCMGPALVALYTAVGAALVLRQEVELGIFLATIKIFQSICSAFYEGFGLVMEVIGVLPDLKDIFVMLNMPTDEGNLGKANEARFEITDARMAMMTGHESVPKVDRLQIELLNVDFAHKSGEPLLFQNINFSCAQGKICVVSAAAGAGRQTLLQLLAQNYFPTNGTLFVPSHLRIVHVSRRVYVLNLSVWENISFGTPGFQQTGDYADRVEKILRHFKMAKVESWCRQKLDMLKNGGGSASDGSGCGDQTEYGVDDVETSLNEMREVELAEIHMARAFIMNPEVLVMHRPFCHFHRSSALTTAMTGHRTNRGLYLPPETVFHRRPRTIFYTTDSPNQLGIADWVWEIPSVVGGVCKQHANQAREKTEDIGLEEDIRQAAWRQTDKQPNTPELGSAHLCEEEDSRQLQAVGAHVGEISTTPHVAGKLSDSTKDGRGAQTYDFDTSVNTIPPNPKTVRSQRSSLEEAAEVKGIHRKLERDHLFVEASYRSGLFQQTSLDEFTKAIQQTSFDEFTKAWSKPGPLHQARRFQPGDLNRVDGSSKSKQSSIKTGVHCEPGPTRVARWDI